MATFEEYLRGVQQAHTQLGAREAQLRAPAPAAPAPSANFFLGDGDANWSGGGGGEGNPLGPLGTAIDWLSRPLYGVTNPIYKGAERQAAEQDARLQGEDVSFANSAANPLNVVGDVLGGVFSTDENNQRYGSELIKDLDAVDNRNNPEYDPEARSDVGDAAAGLAIDIALDPLTYIPFGAIGKAVKGAGRGVTEAVETVGRAADDIDTSIPVVAKTEQPNSPAEEMLDLDAPTPQAAEVVEGASSYTPAQILSQGSLTDMPNPVTRRANPSEVHFYANNLNESFNVPGLTTKVTPKQAQAAVAKAAQEGAKLTPRQQKVYSYVAREASKTTEVARTRKPSKLDSRWDGDAPNTFITGSVNEYRDAQTLERAADDIRNVKDVDRKGFVDELKAAKQGGEVVRDDIQSPAFKTALGKWVGEHQNAVTTYAGKKRPLAEVVQIATKGTSGEARSSAYRFLAGKFLERGGDASSPFVGSVREQAEGFGTWSEAFRSTQSKHADLEEAIGPRLAALLDTAATKGDDTVDSVLDTMVKAYGNSSSKGAYFYDQKTNKSVLDAILADTYPGRAGYSQRLAVAQSQRRIVARLNNQVSDRSAQNLAPVVSKSLRKWREKRDYTYPRASGAKAKKEGLYEGPAGYPDEFNAYDQYTLLTNLNQHYGIRATSRKPTAADRELRAFLQARNVANTRKARLDPRKADIRNLYGNSRAAAVLDFQMLKLKEAESALDSLGLRPMASVGTARTAEVPGTDRVAVSISDAFEVLWDATKGTPENEIAMRTMGHFKTAVAPTALLQAIAATVNGAPRQIVREALTNPITSRKTGKSANNLVSGSDEVGIIPMSPYQTDPKAVAAQLQAKAPEGSGLRYEAADNKIIVRQDVDVRVDQLTDLVMSKADVFKSRHAANMEAYRGRWAQEFSGLADAELKNFDDIIKTGNAQAVADLMRRRTERVAHSARANGMFETSSIAAEKVMQSAMESTGLLPAMQPLSRLDRAVRTKIYSADKGPGRQGAFGVKEPTDQEILAAMKADAEALALTAERTSDVVSSTTKSLSKEVREALESYTGTRPLPISDTHRKQFRNAALRVREEKAKARAIETGNPVPPVAPKPKPAAVAAATTKASKEVDATDLKAVHDDYSDDALKLVQQEHQLMLEETAVKLDEAVDAVDSPAAAVAVREQAEEVIDITLRSSYDQLSETTRKILDPLGKFFVQNYGWSRLHHKFFERMQWQGRFDSEIKKRLNLVKSHAGVARRGDVRGSVLPAAWAAMARGNFSDPTVGPVARELEGVMKLMMATDGSGPISNTAFRATVDADVLNAYLARNQLKPTELGFKSDDAIFDMERAAEAANQSGREVMEELFDQWKTWDVEDPMTVMAKLSQAVSELAQHRAMAADFRGIAVAKGLASKTSKPGYARISASKDTRLGGFIDPDLYYDKSIIKEVMHADEFLRAPKQVKNKLVREYYLPALSVWKRTITLPRPGHHIRNMIGDWSIQAVYRGTRDFARAQDDAVRILSTRKQYDGVDLIQGINREYGDALPTGSQVLVKGNGKLDDFTIDEIYAAADRGGLFPSFHSGEGLIDDGLGTGGFSRVMEKISLQDNKYGDMLGTFSEYRDHYARLGHFMQFIRQEARKGTYATKDELFEAAAKEVRKAHPDATMLTAAESRYMRNIIPFYSWFRGILPAVAETTMRHPDRVMWFPKASTEFAVANGLDPESFADPFPDDQLFPSFLTDEVLGPQMMWGDNYISVDPGFTHVDVFNTVGIDPVRGVLGMVSPFLRAPVELATGTNLSTGGRISDTSDYLDSSIPGINYIANTTGVSPTGSVASMLLGDGLDQQRQVESGNKTDLDKGLSALNWITGLGFLNTTRPSFEKVAQFEERERAREESNG